jgi:hypothetical protein
VARRGKIKRGYVVEIVLLDTANQSFAQYSGEGVTLEMANALATHLKRNRSAGRIRDLATGNVIETWEAQ